ncbi:MAG: hypothetical protein KAI55_01565 [Candidatus Aenigmarchaeota archaeon]|nr:hypothetical protein [Candidatus Aenigmarchaeota archaeon]
MKKSISISPTSSPPTYFFYCIIADILLYFFVPEANLLNFSFNIIGLIWIGFGTYLIIYSWLLFKKHGTTEKFEKLTYLVGKSLYRYSRNPMYQLSGKNTLNIGKEWGAGFSFQ